MFVFPVTNVTTRFARLPTEAEEAATAPDIASEKEEAEKEE